MSAKTSISARIDRMVDSANSKVKAVASVTIGGAFAVHGIKVIDSQKGLFVQMPQSSYEKGGQKHYTDQFHPITANAREELNAAVLDAYCNSGKPYIELTRSQVVNRWFIIRAKK